MQSPLVNKSGMVKAPSKTGMGALRPVTGDITQPQIRSRGLERGVVLEVYPDTFSALVALQDGNHSANLLSKSPIDPYSPSGDLDLPFRGSNVLCSRVDGEVHILGYIAPTDPTTLSEDADNRRVDIVPDTVGAKDGRYKNKGFTRKSGLRPKGMLPGDRGIAGRFGNLMGVLDGGINILRSGEQAQILTYMREQLIKVVARNYKLLTDFGETSYIADTNGVSMKFRGGSSISSETGTEGWTIRGDLGASGNLVDLRTTTKAGFALARLYVDKLGNAVTRAQDLASRVMGNASLYVAGNSTTDIKGDATVNVVGDSTEAVSGSITQTGQAFTAQYSGGHSVTALGDRVELVGGQTVSVSNEGVTVQVPNGAYLLDVGFDSTDSLDIDIKGKQGDFNVTLTQSGDIKLDTGAGNITLVTGSGNVVLDTNSSNDSVVIGANAGTYHLVKHEQLVQLLTTLAGALDDHTHTSSGSGTPTDPITPLISGMLQGIKCNVIKVPN